MSNEEFLTEPQVAEYLKLSISFLRQDRMESGRREIPFVKIGRRAVRYRKRDLDAFMESKLITA